MILVLLRDKLKNMLPRCPSNDAIINDVLPEESTCFEPDIVEYNSLVKDKINNDKIFPYALTNESKEITLNLTKKRSCSSIYKPNLKYLKNYPDVERFIVEDIVTLEATSLTLDFILSHIANSSNC